MISLLFAATLTMQQGPITTPIEPPKPVVTKRVPPATGGGRSTKAGAGRGGGAKVASGRGGASQGRRESNAPPKVFQLTPAPVDNPPGIGEAVKTGDIVTIHFLVKKKGGQDVADSRKRGLPYSFKIGQPGNDPLLDLVVKGMKPGAVRTQTVVASDAYGAGGAPPVIGPKDTLIVTITLIGRGAK